MKIYRTSNYLEMSRTAAMILAAQIQLKPDCVLGLATGSTPIGTYEELVRLHRLGYLDFSGVRSANLDEYRGLDRENEQSYYYFMQHHLFRHINISPENTFIPDGSQQDPDKECARYEQTLKQLGGVDLQILGLGHNGHIGFNEPADTFPKATHCVSLTRSTIEANRRFFEKEEDVPRQAYTMGIGTILQAKKILLLVSGSDKADILKEVITGPVTPQVPASILQFHPDVTVIADEAALARLDA